MIVAAVYNDYKKKKTVPARTSVAPAHTGVWCEWMLVVGSREYSSRNIHSCLCYSTGLKATDVHAHRQAELIQGLYFVAIRRVQVRPAYRSELVS